MWIYAFIAIVTVFATLIVTRLSSINQSIKQLCKADTPEKQEAESEEAPEEEIGAEEIEYAQAQVYADIVTPKNYDGKENQWADMLERAWKIRTFEIDTSWKRTNYFSIVVGALFIGYYNIANITNDTRDEQQILPTLLIILLGFIASLTWFFINKGSKFWQEKWEIEIDLIEKEMGGNKTHSNVLTHKDFSALSPTKTYPFSVSKLNMAFSFIVAIGWAVLFIHEIADNFHTDIAVQISTIDIAFLQPMIGYIDMVDADILNKYFVIYIAVALLLCVLWLIACLGASSFSDKKLKRIAGKTKDGKEIYHYQGEKISWCKKVLICVRNVIMTLIFAATIVIAVIFVKPNPISTEPDSNAVNVIVVTPAPAPTPAPMPMPPPKKD